MATCTNHFVRGGMIHFKQIHTKKQKTLSAIYISIVKKSNTKRERSHSMDVDSVLCIVSIVIVACAAIIACVFINIDIITIYACKYNLHLRDIHDKCGNMYNNDAHEMIHDDRIWFLVYNRLIGGKCVGCLAVTEYLQYFHMHNYCLLPRWDNAHVRAMLHSRADAHCRKRSSSKRIYYDHSTRSIASFLSTNARSHLYARIITPQSPPSCPLREA